MPRSSVLSSSLQLCQREYFDRIKFRLTQGSHDRYVQPDQPYSKQGTRYTPFRAKKNVRISRNQDCLDDLKNECKQDNETNSCAISVTKADIVVVWKNAFKNIFRQAENDTDSTGLSRLREAKSCSYFPQTRGLSAVRLELLNWTEPHEQWKQSYANFLFRIWEDARMDEMDLHSGNIWRDCRSGAGHVWW